MKISHNKLMQIISEEAEKITKKYDDDPALKGDQDELPDPLQKGIIDKEKKDESMIRFTRGQFLQILKEEMEAAGIPVEDEEEIISPEDLIGIVSSVVGDVAAEEEPRVMGHGGTSKMAKSQLFQVTKDAQSLHDQLDDEDEIPEWVQAKIAVAADDIQSVYNHLDYKMVRDESPAIEEQKRKIRRLLRKK